MNMKYFLIAGFIGLLAVLFIFAAVQNKAIAETGQDVAIEDGQVCGTTCNAVLGGTCGGNGCSGGSCSSETKSNGCGCK